MVEPVVMMHARFMTGEGPRGDMGLVGRGWAVGVFVILRWRFAQVLGWALDVLD